MNEGELANVLDRILSDRLREASASYLGGSAALIRRLMDTIETRLGRKSHASRSASIQSECIARLRSLPPDVQEPLRRFLVFQEAEENICWSFNISHAGFQRFLREAADYVLMRRERMPELKPQNAPWPPHVTGIYQRSALAFGHLFRLLE